MAKRSKKTPDLDELQSKMRKLQEEMDQAKQSLMDEADATSDNGNSDNEEDVQLPEGKKKKKKKRERKNASFFPPSEDDDI